MSNKVSQSIGIKYSESSSSSTDCPFVLFEIPDTEIPCGQEMDIYLWAASSSLLAGYSLRKENTNLGTGHVYSDPGEQEEVISFAEVSEVQLKRPIQSGLNVQMSVALKQILDAQGNLIGVANYNGGFIQKGGSCVATSTGEKIYGHGVARYNQGRWRRTWKWVVDCSKKDHWFFIYKDGIIVRKFSVEVDPESSPTAPDNSPRTITLRVIEFSSEAPQENAKIYINNTYRGKTDSYGELDVNLVPGTYALRITKEGFLDSDEDDISNDEFVVT